VSVPEIRRALVLGGTGHIGSAVVRELRSRGSEVTVASRKTSPTPNLDGSDIRFVPFVGDTPSALADLVGDHDLVVDAAAPYPLLILDSDRPRGQDPVDAARRRTTALIDAVRRRKSRLAVISSFTTLPHPGADSGQWEPRLLRRIHPYFAVKQCIEQTVLAAAGRERLRALVINPAAVFGPWDCKQPALCFLPLVLTGKLPFTSRRTINVIDVRDVAAALIESVSTGRFGRNLPLSGHNVRICDLTNDACAIAGIRPPSLVGSTRYGACLALWGDIGWGMLGLRSPVPSLPILLVRYSYPMQPSPDQTPTRP
jgi:nucleoside-diphosphate-sugar epimerase